MTYTVAHGGTGITGKEALAAIIKDPALELVGLYVTSPDKEGKDAGQLAGTGDTGIVATGDLQGIIDLKPDCFCYCGTAVSREENAIEDMASLLAAGINVVTIATIPMIYAPAAPAAWVKQIEDACRKGGSSFYASGSEPGAVSLNLPAAMLGGAGEIDEYEMFIFAPTMDEAYPVHEVLHESMGFAKPEGFVPERIESGKVVSDWSTIILYLGDLLGLKFDDIALEWETLTAGEDIPSKVLPVPAGTISGHRWRLSGVVGGKPRVSVQYLAAFASTPWPETWPKVLPGIAMRVKGRPSMQMIMQFDPDPEDRGKMSVLAFTALAVVNAIPHVVGAAPGIITDPILGRGAVSRLA